MAASPHPSKVGTGGLSLGSPVTPPSSVSRKFSTVPASSSERIELLWQLASHDPESILFSSQLLAFCREVRSKLLRKLNSSTRGRRRTIDKEFDILSSDRLQTNRFMACSTVARLETNLPKNRYIDVLPYDDTRVLLEAKSDSSGAVSSYINASYVVDSTNEALPKFIATQGPLPNTYVDFWEMIVQQQCPVIVMLTGLIDPESKAVKCGNYFPAQFRETQTHGRFTITNKSTRVTKNAVIQRLLEIEQSDGSSSVPVLHFQLDWPDYGVPTSSESVRELFRILYRVPSNFGPFVVHCSAGIGRTGTYCTIDHTLRKILLGDMSAAEIENTVRHFRQQRYGMVQTREQYAFCYAAVVAELEELISGNASQQIGC